MVGAGPELFALLRPPWDQPELSHCHRFNFLRSVHQVEDDRGGQVDWFTHGNNRLVLLFR